MRTAGQEHGWDRVPVIWAVGRGCTEEPRLQAGRARALAGLRGGAHARRGTHTWSRSARHTWGSGSSFSGMSVGRGGDLEIL